MDYNVLITCRCSEAFDPSLQLYRKLGADGYAPTLDTQGAYACDSARLQTKMERCSDVVFVLAPGTFEAGSDDDSFATTAALAAQKGKNRIAVILPGFMWPAQPSAAADALRGCTCVEAGARSFDELYAAVCGVLRCKAKKAGTSDAKANARRILPILLALLLVLAAVAGIWMLKSGRKDDRQPEEAARPGVTFVPSATESPMPAAAAPTASPTAAAATTHTPTATAVATHVPTATAVPTHVPTATAVPAQSSTAVPTHVPTFTPVPTQEAVRISTPFTRGETVTFGRYGDEALAWTVLDSDGYTTRLIGKECIACRSFGSTTDWYRSALRSWLNDDFIRSAFSDAERHAMVEVEGDLVRIPSVADMTNPTYGFSTDPDRRDSARAAKAGRTAKSQGVWVNEDNGRCSYYTMTPNDGSTMKQIRSDGRVGFARIDRSNVGVRVIITVETGALR